MARIAGVPSITGPTETVLPILAATGLTPSTLRAGDAVPVRSIVLPVPSTTLVAYTVTAGASVVPLSRRKAMVRDRSSPLVAFPVH